MAQLDRSAGWARQGDPRRGVVLVTVAALVVVLALGVAVLWNNHTRSPVLVLAALPVEEESATAGTPFPSPLWVSVVSAGGAPARPGTAVTFSAPASGPSATMDGETTVQVATDAFGVASSPTPLANGTEGTYTIRVSAVNANDVEFALLNRPPTIVAAGDIACPPGMPERRRACQQRQTAALAARLGPTAVLPLGDLQYEKASGVRDFGAYAASWGKLKATQRPILGNHEYGYGESKKIRSGGAEYFRYFGDAARPLDPGCTRLCKSWYSYDLGDWHVIALDSQCHLVGGCGPGSEQYTWLASDLASYQQQCLLAYWHVPVLSSSSFHDPAMRQAFALLHEEGGDVVLTAHDHFYERFGPTDGKGRADPSHGMRQFIVGTGGRSLYPYPDKPAAHSGYRSNDTFGVLQMTLRHDGYSWRFATTPTGAVTDSGTAECHGRP